MDIKTGIKTSEFWVSIAPVLVSIVENRTGNEELSKYFLICGTVLGIIYIVSRTMVKLKFGIKNEAEV